MIPGGMDLRGFFDKTWDSFAWNLVMATRVLGNACPCGKIHLPLAPQIHFLDDRGARMTCCPAGRGDDWAAPGAAALMIEHISGVFESLVVQFMVDGYTSVWPKNPETGLPWTVDEIHETARHKNGLARGLVTDAVIVEISEVGAANHISMAIPYIFSRDDGLVFSDPKPYPNISQWLTVGAQRSRPDALIDAAENATGDLRNYNPRWITQSAVIETWKRRIPSMKFAWISREDDDPKHVEIMGEFLHGDGDILA